MKATITSGGDGVEVAVASGKVLCTREEWAEIAEAALYDNVWRSVSMKRILAATVALNALGDLVLKGKAALDQATAVLGNIEAAVPVATGAAEPAEVGEDARVHSLVRSLFQRAPAAELREFIGLIEQIQKKYAEAPTGITPDFVFDGALVSACATFMERANAQLETLTREVPR